MLGKPLNSTLIRSPPHFQLQNGGAFRGPGGSWRILGTESWKQEDDLEVGTEGVARTGNNLGGSL